MHRMVSRIAFIKYNPVNKNCADNDFLFLVNEPTAETLAWPFHARAAYFSLKVMGTWTHMATGFPSCVPGVNRHDLML
jgi:hypothetical protein